MMAKFQFPDTTTQFQFRDATNSPVQRGGPIPYPSITMQSPPQPNQFKHLILLCGCSMQGCNKSPTCTLPKTNAMVCTDCYKEQTGGYPLPSIKRSTGDEAGTTGGVASGVMMGPSRHSSNKVIIDGALKGSLMNQHHGQFLIPSQTKVMVMS